mgnify:CR=1 FL=1
MCGTASRLSHRFARHSTLVFCIRNTETPCDTLCQVNKLFFPWLCSMLFCVENVLSTSFAVLQCWLVSTWFWMRHKQICAELDKLLCMRCFQTVRACQFFAQLAPLETPIVKRMTNTFLCCWKLRWLCSLLIRALFTSDIQCSFPSLMVRIKQNPFFKRFS